MLSTKISELICSFQIELEEIVRVPEELKSQNLVPEETQSVYLFQSPLHFVLWESLNGKN